MPIHGDKERQRRRKIQWEERVKKTHQIRNALHLSRIDAYGALWIAVYNRSVCSFLWGKRIWNSLSVHTEFSFGNWSFIESRNLKWVCTLHTQTDFDLSALSFPRSALHHVLNGFLPFVVSKSTNCLAHSWHFTFRIDKLRNDCWPWYCGLLSSNWILFGESPK